MKKLDASEKRKWLTSLTFAICTSEAGSKLEVFLFEWFRDLGGFPKGWGS